MSEVQKILTMYFMNLPVSLRIIVYVEIIHLYTYRRKDFLQLAQDKRKIFGSNPIICPNKSSYVIAMTLYLCVCLK